MNSSDSAHLWLWHIGLAIQLVVIVFHFAVVTPYLRKRSRLKFAEEFSTWRIPSMLNAYAKLRRWEGCSTAVADVIRGGFWFSLVLFLAGGLLQWLRPLG